MLRALVYGLLPSALLAGALLVSVTPARTTTSPGATISPDTSSSLASRAARPVAFRSERAHFAVRFGREVIPYRIFGVFVMPGERVRLSVMYPDRSDRYTLEASEGDVASAGSHRWQWRAPEEPGVHILIVADTTGETIRLNAFVLTPFDHRSTSLDGYRIGRYRKEALRGLPNYRRPPGFFKVTAANRHAHVSPHFTIGQFLCKQGTTFPQYLILRERLVMKLEMILEEVNERGHAASTLHVMSGFRTPHYNRSIGNRTDYSRHLYGGAADIFVDADGDEYMDDLDGDGRATEADAEVLADIVRRQAEEPWYKPFVGGMGVYGAAPHRGPFVHVDVRGYRARW